MKLQRIRIYAAFFIVACITQMMQTASAAVIRSDTSRPHFGRAVSLLLLTELVPFLYDRYGKNAGYARISVGSISHNLSPGHWSWDRDEFPTNQIGHPFHGSQFFNSFRTTGHNFWQSVPAAFAGSYLWETFAENEPPSYNDFINTGFGGVMLGEVTHRISERVFQSRRKGFWKEAAKIGATILNPVDGFNRIMTRQWNHTSAKEKPAALNAEADIGLRKFSPNRGNPFADGGMGPYTRIRISYGSPAENIRTPFSHITLSAEIGPDDTSFLNMITLRGSLRGWKLSNANSPHLLSLSADYDYLSNAAFFFSAESIKLNLHSDWDFGKLLTIQSSFGLGPVLLAAVPNSSSTFVRNYDYGPGFSFYGAMKILLTNRIQLNPRYNGGWMITSNGSRSRYYLHMFTSELSLRLQNNWWLSAESGHFTLYGNYKQPGDYRYIYPYLRISLRFTLL